MTTKPELPLYRVSFARITGQDDNGKDILAKPREIGAVWARKNGKGGGILQLDIVPAELILRQGVLFLAPASEEGGAK